MGNCIHVLCHPPQEKIKVLIFNGGVQEFKASTPVQEITSSPYIGFKLAHHAQPHTPLPPNTKLEPGGEVYRIVPNLAGLGKPLVPSNKAHRKICRTQKIKIVVTREQLELLLRSTNKFKSKEMGSRLSERFGSEGPPKWRPSLAIIPEVHNL